MSIGNAKNLIFHLFEIEIKRSLNHCVESVQIRSFSWAEYRKIQTTKTPFLDTFHAVNLWARVGYPPLISSAYLSSFKETWKRRLLIVHNSSVIRQMGESHDGCYKETKHAKFSKKQTFLTPWYARVLIRGKKCSFLGLFFIILKSYGKIDNTCGCNYCSLSIVTQKHIINQKELLEIEMNWPQPT